MISSEHCEQIALEHIVNFQMDKNEENFVPRVHQLDALALDQEIFIVFRNTIQTALKHFLR
jgi:hypothetical protein